MDAKRIDKMRHTLTDAAIEIADTQYGEDDFHTCEKLVKAEALIDEARQILFALTRGLI